jgi:hypothetical protein
MPVRFGTWFWGLGGNRQIFVPDKIGRDYDLKEELTPLKDVRDHINLFTNYRIYTDSRPSLCHYSGWVAIRCGEAPVSRTSVPGESIDVTIADAVAGSTRFRSLEVAATASRQSSLSFRSADAVNPPEISPMAFYQRVFGSEFQDPNAPDFRPNPEILVRKSVLSAVMEDSQGLSASLGSADRARLDQYFTSLRGIEQRLAGQLQKPPPALACVRPRAPMADPPTGTDADLVAERHKLMTDILIAAMACDQTRIFNMAYSDGSAATTKSGVPNAHHPVTHEEPLNADGIQPTHSWFVRRAMESWAYFVTALASVNEGDRTLLDNTLVFAHSDQETARTHSMDGIPMMTAGTAGGRINTGLHVPGGKESTVTQVGLTLLRAMGLEKYEWGAGSMRTSQLVDGIIKA